MFFFSLYTTDLFILSQVLFWLCSVFKTSC